MNKSNVNASFTPDEAKKMLKKNNPNTKQLSLQFVNGGARLKFSNDDNGCGFNDDDS